MEIQLTGFIARDGEIEEINPKMHVIAPFEFSITFDKEAVIQKGDKLIVNLYYKEEKDENDSTQDRNC